MTGGVTGIVTLYLDGAITATCDHVVQEPDRRVDKRRMPAKLLEQLARLEPVNAGVSGGM